MIKIKRIYEDYSKTDGYRILIDRLWPRGISKERAKIDLWIKEIAPSHDLRKWYSHNSEKAKQFQKKYIAELEGNPNSLNEIKKITTSNEKTIVLEVQQKVPVENNKKKKKIVVAMEIAFDNIKSTKEVIKF